MVQFSNAEKLDMICIYDEARMNAKEAVRIYANRYPDRRLASDKTFISLAKSLARNGCFNERKRKKQKAATDENHAVAVLGQMVLEPHSSTREIAMDCDISKSSIQRILSKYKFHPYKIHLVQGLQPDRAVFIWEAKDFTQRDRKTLRVNIDFDFATLVKWSPDSKAFIVHKYNENAVEVYKMEKKKEGKIHATKALTFPKSHETDEIIAMGIASNGKFIMTCSNKTDMIIWDLKGQILAHIDTYLMNTICAKISPCGKFVVASGFTPEAKIWEIIFDKTGEFQEVKQIPQLALGGHSSGIYDVAFDVDSSHMATVSKDGTWRLFDTKVHYQLGEDARLIRTGKYDQPGGKKSESPDSTSNRGREKNHALIALSPNAEVLAIATSSNLAFYSTLTGELDYTIEDIFSGLGSHCDIRSIMFDPSGKYILVGGGKQIKVFHNVTGYRCAIETAKIKLKDHQTSATKERLQKLIADNNEFLDNMKKA